MKTANNNTKQVVPYHLNEIQKEVKDQKDLLFLGKGNLTYFARFHRSAEEKQAQEISDVEERIKILEQIMNGNLSHMIAKYNHPTISSIEVLGAGECAAWAPKNEEDLKRATGSTNFNLCGWCEHCASIDRRGNCQLMGVCSLVAPAIYGRWPNAGKLSFTSPCVLSGLTHEQLQASMDYQLEKLSKLNDLHELTKARAGYIEELVESAEEKPCFPCARPAQWLEDGAQVQFYVSPDYPMPFKAGQFVAGVIAANEEGAITKLQLQDVGESSCGRARPELLKDWEYNYLKGHSDYLDLWMKSVGNIGFDRRGFCRAMKAS